MSRVGSLHDDDPLVLPKPVVELAIPNVDRKDLDRTSLQQAIGETTGRCAEVGDGPPGRIVAERIERSGELDPPA